MKFVDCKSALIASIVYASDRSKAVALVLSLFCVALWFLLWDISSFFLIFLLFVLVFFSPVSFGKSVLFVLLFVYFARVNFCPFSLPLGVRDWLRFVIVALLLVSGIGCGL